MTERAAKGAPSRLVDAAVAAAGRINVDTATVSRIVEAIGVPIADFDAAFPALEKFFEALQVRFLDGRLNRVIEAAGHLPAGMGRIRAAWGAYLDYSLEVTALYTLCRRARLRYPVMRGEVSKRNHTVHSLLNTELTSLKVADPLPMARLVSAMVFEAARIENDAGQPAPAAREAIFAFVESLIPR